MPDNAIRGPVNALTLRLLDGYAHALLGERKRRLFGDLPDTVVELGPGTGANLRYYRPGTKVIAIEPNRHMHRTLLAAADRYGIEVSIRAESADSIGLPDGAVDAVVATLVLCTVPDPLGSAGEAHRILRPGGRLVFVEHVAAPAGTACRRLQGVMHRPWRWFFEGCDVLRDTETMLRNVGFTTIDVERYAIRGPLVPIRPQIAGVAVR